MLPYLSKNTPTCRICCFIFCNVSEQLLWISSQSGFLSLAITKLDVSSDGFVPIVQPFLKCEIRTLIALCGSKFSTSVTHCSFLLFLFRGHLSYFALCPIIFGLEQISTEQAILVYYFHTTHDFTNIFPTSFHSDNSWFIYFLSLWKPLHTFRCPWSSSPKCLIALGIGLEIEKMRTASIKRMLLFLEVPENRKQGIGPCTSSNIFIQVLS